IVGVPVHVVAGRCLTGPAVPAPVVGHDSEALLLEEQHLAVPCIGAQWPPVREGHHGAFSPVLVIDGRAVFGRHRGHGLSYSCERTSKGLYGSDHAVGNAKKIAGTTPRR